MSPAWAFCLWHVIVSVRIVFTKLPDITMTSLLTTKLNKMHYSVFQV
jgi:hypothetical protein